MYDKTSTMVAAGTSSSCIVPILFTRQDSVYKCLGETDCYDVERDAKSYTGETSVVAHPPCRSWGNLSHLAKPRVGERELANWAIEKIRKVGGVLEHPKSSKLWKEMNLPQPGEIDEFGGFTFPVFQQWFGHKAQKATNLYIYGCQPRQLPDIPLVLGEASHVVTRSNAVHRPAKPSLSAKAREATPLAFAKWLIEVAKVCEANKVYNKSK